ncbi:MAG: glycosyltransferase, partial [Chromatiales bacterium]|nr:glycosyltransferase [Chromatiales bacterium]
MSTSFVVSAGAKVHPWRVPGRIAYVVSYAYPYASHGYAVRTHGVATALQQHGHSVIVISRPGHPWDLEGFDDPAFPLHHEIDGVRYLTLREPSARALTSEAWQAAAAGALEATLRVFKPSVVMAASNWENALPALKAAQALGVPFFYEIRGFWEVTRASREPEWAQSPEYRQAIERKTWIAQQAERVFTLNGLMRDELV